MLRATWTLTCALGILAAVSARAASPVSTKLEEDDRLRMPVTLEFGKTPLSGILAQLGSRVGVSLRAAPEVADEPAIVFAHDLPAREVMQRIGAHFNYRWRGTATAQGTRWELYQDLKSRQEEAAARTGETLAALRALLAGIQERLAVSRKPSGELLAAADRYDDARKEGPAALARLPNSPEFALMRRSKGSWQVRELAVPANRALLQLAQTLRPATWDELAAGEVLRFSSAEEPGFGHLETRWVRTLRDSEPAHLPPGIRVRYGNPDGVETAHRLDEMTKSQWRRAIAYRIRIALDLQSDQSAGIARLKIAPSTVMPPDFGGEQHMNAPPLQIEERSQPDEPPVEPEPPLKDAVLARAERWQPLPRRAEDTDPSVDWLNEELVAAARLYHINLVADAYRHHRYALWDLPKSDRLTLREWLRAYVRPVARWERKGEWILVRRRRWFQDRLEEIPAGALDRWSQDLRQTGAFSSDDLGRLASELRKEQIRHFPAALRTRGVVIDDEFGYLVPMNYEFLHAWGSLSAGQRESLREGNPLPFRALPLYGRRSFEALFAQRAREEELPATNALQQAALESIPVKQKTLADEEPKVGVWLTPDGMELHRFELPRGKVVPEATLRDRAFKITFPGGAMHYFYAISPGVRVMSGTAPVN